MREAAKYTTKSPSPLRAEWIGGDARRSVVHPATAAAWVVATRHRKLSQPYGLAREALAVVRAREKETAPEPEVCGCCGASALSLASLVPTDLVARRLGPAWSRGWRGRASSRFERAFRGAPELIPPRVAIGRAVH